VDAYLASERQLAAPYYGIGNDSPYDPALDNDINPYWYRFGRTRSQLRVNAQRELGWLGLRAVVGGGIARVSIDPIPKDSGTTLLAAHLGAHLPPPAATGGWSNYVRVGVIRDTRDREVGARRGAWTELIVQRVDRALGSASDYTRWTLIDRRYVPLSGSGRLVFANRVLLQQVTGDAPFYDLYLVESSFKQQEGLGGAKTLRGVLKNRLVGTGLLLWNAALRWRALEFSAIGRQFHVVFNGFVDSGRVWETGDGGDGWLDEFVDLATKGGIRALHHGYGAGALIGMGENFVVAVDVGRSAETSGQIYVGLGYLY
jgi:outer membrane protein assembly factor BamA